MNGGEVGDEGGKSLEDLELYVYTLRHVVVDCLDDSSRDRREGDGAQGDEVSEGAEGNGENWKFISWGEVSTMGDGAVVSTDNFPSPLLQRAQPHVQF